MRRLLPALALGVVSCTQIDPPGLSQLSSFRVVINDVFRDEVGIVAPLDVVAPCAAMYGGQSAVPKEARGTEACAYVIPRGEIQIEVTATALDNKGREMTTFDGPVAWKVVPGDLTGDYSFRWSQAQGGVAHGFIKTTHQYGRVRVWGEHAPPKLLYSDGGYAGDLNQLPKAPDKWTYATGLSPFLWFEEPTLAKVQIPDGDDNRSSPLVGEFLTIGRPGEAGKLVQSCPNDPANNGQPVAMVVTGTDPSGFFVTDLTACRLLENSTARPPEPNEACNAGTCEISQGTCQTSADCLKYAPGTFGHMFIYNYSYPEGLNPGDLLFAISGSVQEFTSTTQLTFPSWTIAERVRLLPQEQWNKWLDRVPIVDINMRMCGQDDVFSPFLTDALCGHNRRNLKLEANESGLVRVRNARFPQKFVNCDSNGDATVPFFCEQTNASGQWIWGSCGFGEVEPVQEMEERICNHDCVIGLGAHANSICTEASTFVGFGQFVVELTPPGLPGTRLDSSLPNRYQVLNVGSTAATHMTAVPAGSAVAVVCNAPAHYRFGNGTAVDATDPVLQPGEVLRRVLAAGETKLAVLAEGTPVMDGKCSIGIDARVRMNVVTKDAIPDLKVDCREDDPDMERASSCRAMHAATFDIVGHLRQVQPARPRWVILPRDTDDVCCRPAPGMGCPRPIKQCENLSP